MGILITKSSSPPDGSLLQGQIPLDQWAEKINFFVFWVQGICLDWTWSCVFLWSVSLCYYEISSHLRLIREKWREGKAGPGPGRTVPVLSNSAQFLQSRSRHGFSGQSQGQCGACRETAGRPARRNTSVFVFINITWRDSSLLAIINKFN